MAETYEAGTPQWWVARLNKQLDARRPTIDLYDRYYQGQHRLAFATSKFREAFGVLFSAFSDNWAQLVVDASVERLKVEGFRFGDNIEGDKDAWAIWQANNLDSDSVMAHTEAVKCGTAYLLVAPGDSGPLITVEHPSQTIVEHHAGSHRQRAAAFKKWADLDSGLLHATLYLPDAVYRLESERKQSEYYGQTGDVRWSPRAGVAAEVANPLGVVPVVPLSNNPGMLTGGRSDLVGVIPIQDAVNKLVADMIVASEFAAFRQRWATGIEVPTDPETGQPLRKQFDAAVDRMWATGSDNAKFGEFSATDLSNYVKAIEMLVQHIAAQTRTPPHYLLGQSGSFPSGESLKSTETGLVAKVVRKQIDFGEGYEEALRLAFALQGDQRATAVSAETIWKDPESRTEGQHVDALLKMGTLGVPQEALWERYGASPQEIERWKVMQRQQALEASLLNVDMGLGQGLPPDASQLPQS